jgi:dipeptidyl aminopeptidase/acylaminoacyl peptidase
MFRRLWEKEQREEAAKDLAEKRKEKRREIPTYGPPKGFNVRGVSVSPSGRHVAITLSKSGVRGRSADMPDYVTDDGYSKMRSTRSKVGDKSAERRLEVMDMESGDIVQVGEPAEKRGAYPGSPSWSATGELLVAQARSDDDEDLWLLKVDPATGKTTTLHHRHDDAWVGSSDGRPQWLGDSGRVFFVSEKTGWMQLWIADVATGETRRLTEGAFEIRRPVATPDGKKIYAIATPTSPHVGDLVEISPESGSITVLTADGGGRSFSLSPDGTKVAEVFSTANTPWELRIRWLDGSREPVVLTDSPSPAFNGYGRWRKPPIVWFVASDGVEVPARLYRPEKPLPGKPAVLFVHGAGYLQNVHNWWSSYYREYGFHHLLCDAGYTILDVDYRGSAGYGRDWRTAIYGHMGGRDLGDYVDAARWLVETEKCGKLGIYGGSYGGFMTLMALFTSPGTFTAGAALRPVTDWAHYNDGYTSNILDDPLESPEHYRKSSPIWHAEGLRDHLLVCHGVLDSNVHAQGVFRLQQRLIELRKKNWEVAYYPLEGHGFTDAASWYDEYRRIKELFDRTLPE